jgi:ferredoxin
LSPKPLKRRVSLPRAFRIALAALVVIAAAQGYAGEGAASAALIRFIAAWQAFPLVSRGLRALMEALSGTASAAVIKMSVGTVLFFAFSAVFGRWFCAALCPLGGLQDFVSFIGGRKMAYRKPPKAARALSFVAVMALAAGGAMSIASYLDPWSLFGRFMADGVQPLFRVAARKDNPGSNLFIALIPAACVAVILGMAFLRGRWFCGTLCPVGSVLGFLNRGAPFRVRFEDSGCVSCGACARRCPASCIDVEAMRLDASRCVNCLACVDACPTKAMRYGLGIKGSAKESAVAEYSLSRKAFLASLGGGAALIAFAALPGKALASGALPAGDATVPPGALSRKRFLETCTACGLCAASCPSRVLQPSLGQLGARGLLVPRLEYGISYCQYECTTCLDLCPSGALLKIPIGEKKLVKIGNAALVKDRCIVIVKRTKCGACAEHCPTGAVRMVVGSTGLPEPVFSSDICIGCGACHHACPVVPLKAITVSGLAIHERAATPALDLFDSPGEGGADGKGGSGAGPGAGEGDFPF